MSRNDYKQFLLIEANGDSLCKEFVSSSDDLFGIPDTNRSGLNRWFDEAGIGDFFLVGNNKIIIRLDDIYPDDSFKVGDLVQKKTGDYTFPGPVRARFRSSNGVRYVVECPVKEVKGILHIYSTHNLKLQDKDVD